MRSLTVISTQVTALNEYDFRNPNEVLTLLKQLKIDIENSEKLLEKYQASELTASDKPLELKRFGVSDSRNINAPINMMKQGAEKLKPGSRPKFKTTESNAIGKNFILIQDYQRQLELVDSLNVRVQSVFKDSKKLKSLLAEVKTRKTEIEAGLKKAMAFVESIAGKHLPKEVEEVFRQTVNPVLRKLEGKYKKKTMYLEVNSFGFDKSQYIQFTQTTELNDLKNDKGFTYRSFYIVVTCTIDAKGHHTFFIDTAYKKETPSTEPLTSHGRGPAFHKARDGLRLLQTHLKVDNSLELEVPGSMPLKQADADTITGALKDYIKSSVVDEEERTVRFVLVKGLEPGPKLQNVLKSILAAVGSILHGTRKLSNLKYKNPTKTVSGSYAITIWFAASIFRGGEKYRDDSNVVQRLKTELGLSNSEVDAINRVLKSRNLGDEHDD